MSLPTQSPTLEHLASLWEAEREATRARFRAERSALSLTERVAKGLALRDLEVDDADALAGGRMRLWLSCRKPIAWDDLRISVGDPVCLWWEQPEEPEALRAVIARRESGRLAVVLDEEPPERVWDGGFRLDREAPEATFDRGARALGRLLRDARSGSAAADLAQLWFGDRVARFEAGAANMPSGSVFDARLNRAQRAAVQHAFAATDVALIHGPPGTGKTRTLVEVVRQAVAQGERVLVTAASNTAVDNLAERLVAAGLGVVRLGHPARVSAAMEACTLDALVEASDAHKLAKSWMVEAAELRRRAARRHARGAISHRERRGMLQEAGRLTGDARKLLASAQDLVVHRMPVVCATAAGADLALLRRVVIDRVVLDEATQAPDPIALIALLRAPRAVLAGDPCQLPPTVIDARAAREGLGVTLFERLAARQPETVRMLEVQHRMHAVLMRFPSEQMYAGRLQAAPTVSEHTLEGLGVMPDPLRPGPLIVIDTAGRGWDEERAVDDPSTRNPGHAERVAAEVARLVRRGLAPRDLAVITPYDAQARLLRSLMPALRAQGLEIGTVDGFQGREKEAVVVDLVRSNAESALGFLNDVRRMNVALTRARRFLMVVGDSATLGAHPYYGAFLCAAERDGAWISAWSDDPDEGP